MIKLSALIIANNEEKQLKQCIETVKFADEIVIILDKCKDNSNHDPLQLSWSGSKRHPFAMLHIISMCDSDE